MTATCPRNKIPNNIKPFTHHAKVDSTHQQCKAMRFENPILAIQQCKAKDGKKATPNPLYHFSQQEELT